MLQVESLAARDAAGAAATQLEELRETARNGTVDVRHIARRLRPEALEDLGLQSALAALPTAFAEQAHVRVDRRLEPPPALSAEQELVVYRVAQEALTNVARHAGATQVELRFEHEQAHAVLTVRDDGRGIPPDARRSSQRHPRHARARDADRRRAAHPPLRAGGTDGHARRSRWTGRAPHERPAEGPRADRRRPPDRAARARPRARRPARPRGRRGGARRRAGGRRARSQATSTSPILDVSMPRKTGLQAAREIAAAAARRARADALDARQRGVPVRGDPGGRLRLRAQERGRPRPRRGVPRGDARRAVPLPRRGARADARVRRARPLAASRPAASRSPPREQEIVKLVAEAHTNDEIARAAESSPRRPSSATARTSSRSSGCATASS